MSTIHGKQMNLMRHLLGLEWSSWPRDLGLYPDHLTTTAENARKGALITLAGGDHVRARRYLAQGGIEGQDEFDKLTCEFARLVADNSELMESLPDPTAQLWPQGRPAIPGRQPSWGPARRARHAADLADEVTVPKSTPY